MNPILCIDVQRYKEKPLYTVSVVDIDNPVNFHSYDCIFRKQGENLDELKDIAQNYINRPIE